MALAAVVNYVELVNEEHQRESSVEGHLSSEVYRFSERCCFADEAMGEPEGEPAGIIGSSHTEDGWRPLKILTT